MRGSATSESLRLPACPYILSRKPRDNVPATRSREFRPHGFATWGAGRRSLSELSAFGIHACCPRNLNGRNILRFAASGRQTVGGGYCLTAGSSAGIIRTNVKEYT